MTKQIVTRYIVKLLDRVHASTLRRFNASTLSSHSSFSTGQGFTVIELIVTITVIVVLSGMVLSTVGYARKKAARSRAESEIAAMAAACESYKVDNGIYPTNAATTELLDSTASFDPTNYQTASQYLYGQLAGDLDFDGFPDSNSKSYMQFKPNTLGRDNANKVYPRDPFGNSYGYSTRMAATLGGGYNPTFDLWSTAGGTTQTDVPGWIKNW